jgi:hypothetical protein
MAQATRHNVNGYTLSRAASIPNQHMSGFRARIRRRVDAYKLPVHLVLLVQLFLQICQITDLDYLKRTVERNMGGEMRLPRRTREWIPRHGQIVPAQLNGAIGLNQPLPVSASSLLPITSAAKPSAEGMNAAYTLSVVDGVEWPKRPATTCTGTPSLSCIVADEWRTSCRRMTGNPAARDSVWNRRVRVCGLKRIPSTRQTQ